MEDNSKVKVTKESNTIVIDLVKSMNSRSFEGSEIIHQAEFNKVLELIDHKIKHLDKNDDSQVRFNDTITILGSRGSGKTSFLMSVLKNYKNNDDVEVIELIDPTLIEEKGHIFLTLISLIQAKVENVINKKECNPCCKDYQLRKCWENELKKLAAGLPSIDIETTSLYANWDDPEHVMKKGLEAVKAAKELELNFNILVYEALRILNKKAFLIAFDDIDINFNNGWKVLETIRKYLTSPKIITVLSGDIKLFSKAIRKQQWINFGEELLKNEGERLNKMEKYDELVTEIEGQYMQKIMKAPYRIHLSTIGEMINNNDIHIKILAKEEETETKQKSKEYIYNYYKERLNVLGLQNKYEIHSVNTYLLGLPLRTQIQLLKQFEDVKNKDNKNLDILNITDAFVSDMYESGVDVELAKSQPKDFCYLAHEFLMQKQLFNETYQLLPTSGSVNYNAVLFSLFTMFVAHSKNNPSMFFEYWITIATIKNLLTIMPYRSELKKESTIVPTIEDLAEYSFIGQNKVYRDICSYLSTYIRATLNYNRGSEIITPWGGTIILRGLAKKANKSKKTTKDRIDQILANKSLMSKQLAFFPMSIASFGHKQQSIVIYSFYTLLGTIVELLKRYNVITNNKNNEYTDKEIIDEIHVLLKELSQVKDNVMPAFEKTTDFTDRDPVFNDIDEEQDDSGKELAKILYIWMKEYPECVPPHLIGKIATRAFYAMRNLDDKESSNKNIYLGDAVHKRITIIMNSVLVEDVKENAENFNLSNNNPSEKNDIFINNLKKVNHFPKETANLKFSRWMLSCPLFLLYLNPGSESQEIQCELNDLWQNLNKFSIDSIYKSKEESGGKDSDSITINNEWFRNNSIYEIIKLVSIWGSKKKNASINKELNNFSLTKKNIEKTVNLTKSIYNQPEIYLNDDITTIKYKLKTIFKESGLTEKNIRKLQEYCEGCKTWDEVIDKVIGNK